MSNVSIEKNTLDDLAEMIAAKSGEVLPLSLPEMIDAVHGIPEGGGGITPAGNINITQAGVTDVTNYATATVPAVSYVTEAMHSEDIPISFEVDQGTGEVIAFTGDYYSFDPVYTPGYADQNGTLGIGVFLENRHQLPTQAAATITPTTSAQTAVAAGKWTTGDVTVAAMPTGTAGTPTATKGTVSNHAVTVTPSVTNQAGYIAGGTKTGTGVQVTAAELVSGSETKTENGTYDVTNLAQLIVDVQGGAEPLHVGVTSGSPVSSGEYITFTNLPGRPTSFALMALEDLSPAASQKIAAVVYDGTTHHTSLITNTSNAQVTYSSVACYSQYSEGSLTIYGQGFLADTYGFVFTYGGGTIDTKDVQVGSGATTITFTGLEEEPAYWSLVFKSNFGTSSGYQRVIAVSDNSVGISGLEMDSGAHPSNAHWTASYNNGSLTITSQGTNAGGYFHQPGYYQLTYAYDSSGNYQSKVVTPTTSQQVVQADSGYDALKKVTVNPIPSEYIVPSGNLPITSNGNNINVAQYETVSVNVPTGGGSVNVDTKTITNSSASNTSISFTGLSGEPKAFFVRCTSQLTRSSNSSYYYVTDMRWNGSSGNHNGNYWRMSNGTFYNDTSHYSHTYSNGTLTISSSGSRSAAGGSFYNGGYELVYVY